MDVYRETKGSHCRWEEFDGRCRSGDLTEGECLRALSGRVLKGLVQLLGVATREQTKAIFEHIMEVGFYWNTLYFISFLSSLCCWSSHCVYFCSQVLGVQFPCLHSVYVGALFLTPS